MVFGAAFNGKEGQQWGMGTLCDSRCSYPVGVVLPLHHLCGVHHAALQHAGRHHRQRAHLLLPHHRAERLPVCDAGGQGAPGLAGGCTSPVPALIPPCVSEVPWAASWWDCWYLAGAQALLSVVDSGVSSGSPATPASIHGINTQQSASEKIRNGGSISLIAEWWYDCEAYKLF